MALALLTVAELAVVMRRSPSWVNRMVAKGGFPFEAIETLGVRQFRRVDVEAFLGIEITEDDIRRPLELAS